MLFADLRTKLTDTFTPEALAELETEIQTAGYHEDRYSQLADSLFNSTENCTWQQCYDEVIKDAARRIEVIKDAARRIDLSNLELILWNLQNMGDSPVLNKLVRRLIDLVVPDEREAA